MRKLKKIGLLFLFSTLIFGCDFTVNQPENDKNIEKPGESSQPESSDPIQPEDPTDSKDITTIEGSKLESNAWYFTSYDLSEYASQTVKIELSCKIKTSSSNKIHLMWQINNSEYPIVAEANVGSEWVELKGTKEVSIAQKNQLYLSTYQIDFSNLTIYIGDFSYKVTALDSSDNNTDDVITNKTNWLSDSTPSLKETYKDIFDSFGLACEYGNFGTWGGTPVELYYKEVQNGLKKHADSITLGNELKPQFMLCWWGNGDGAKQKMTSFTASNGQTIQVPETIQGLSRLNDILTILKNNNLKMRGHVLTWHSQTPDDFFAEGYSAKYNDELISNPVSKDVMTARHEWYIKTILEYVNDWEAENGYGTGNHIIWTWDVVNEAIADDATKTDYLRGSTSGTKDKTPTPPAGSNQAQGSRWYQIYQSDEFIVNAFRFANAYAPSDVPLAYNDYNEYMDYEKGWKTTGILNLIESIKNGEAQTINGKSVAPRIDVMGMQSHVNPNWPGVSGYENALKRYLAAGVDVHVSEFDIAATSTGSAKSAYSDYFKMLKKYGKNYSGKNKITNVTIWGLNNENSWISKDGTQYPLLFNKINNEYIPNASFDAVIEAAKN
jgi:endo-1,4-beta-xylanase